MVVNWFGIFGLIASFFSIIYAYSRQLFTLSRAGYLPRAFAATVLASYEAALWSAGAFGVMVGYFVLVSRHRLVANAPEEEF